MLSNFSDDLDMGYVAAKFVRKLLNFDQKQCQMELLNEVSGDTELFKQVITGDETWV